MKYGRMGGRRGILACIQQELCVQNLHGGSVERTISRRSRHSSPHKVVVSRRLNRTSLVFAKSTQFHISPPDFSSFPFSRVPPLSSNPSGIHPRISRLLILISCESFLFSCFIFNSFYLFLSSCLAPRAKQQLQLNERKWSILLSNKIE